MKNFQNMEMEDGSLEPKNTNEKIEKYSPEFLRSLKAVVIGDWKNAEETFATAEIIITNGGVILLTGRVQNVNLYLFTVEHHLLPVRIRFGGLIVFHKLCTGGDRDVTITKEDKNSQKKKKKNQNVSVLEYSTEIACPIVIR